MSVNITPKLLATLIEKVPATGNINVRPSILATVIENPPKKGNINIKPFVLATVIEHPPITGNVTATPFLFATIKPQEVFNGDTLRELKGEDDPIFNGDTLRYLCEKFSGDTLRKLTKYEVFVGDTQRDLREVFSGDTEIKILKTEKFSGDTIIRVPFILKYKMEEPQPARSMRLKTLKSEKPFALMNTLKDLGITSLSIDLNAMTLSDIISIESATYMKINEAIQGQLFNLFFSGLVEHTSRRELIQSIDFMYNQDEILYTQVKFDPLEIGKTLTDFELYTLRKNIPTVNNWYSKVDDDGKLLISYISQGGTITQAEYQTFYASDGHKMNKDEVIRYLITQNFIYSANYIVFIANALGLKTYIKINDFHNTQLANYMGNYATYIEILQNAYSWSSTIPHRQINVFVRGDTLYVIQRGLEDDIFDITDIPHSLPNIEEKLLRTTWEKEIVKVKWESKDIPNDDDDDDEEEDDDDDDDDDEEDDEEDDDDDDEEDDDDDDEEDDDDDDDDDPTPYTGIIYYRQPDGTVEMSISYDYGLIDREYKTIITTNDLGTTTTKSDTSYTYDYYYPKVQGTPSTNPKKDKSNKTNKQQKATVYTNKKSFERALKQWQKQKDKAERQYQRQLEKLRKQQQKALDQLKTQKKAIWFVTSQDTTVTTTSETYQTEIYTQKINRYDGIGDSTYLFEERELTTTTEYNRGANTAAWIKGNESTSIRQTFHTPVGNGYYAHTQYLDGEFQNASLSQGKPFQQVTQFTANQIQKGWNKTSVGNNDPYEELKPPDIGPVPVYEPEKENNKEPTPAGGNKADSSYNTSKSWYPTYEVDTSFPTDDENVARELEGALEWLNRKTQETVTVEIYGEVNNGIPEVQHIVDFTEKVLLDGNIYYLESNNINLTPTRLSQRLKLVRWY